jgi:hypothetical protein
MQIYAPCGYFTDLRLGRQPDLETKEECHTLLMIVGKNVCKKYHLVPTDMFI